MIRLSRFKCISLGKEIGCCDVAAKIYLIVSVKSILKLSCIVFKSSLVSAIENRYQCFFSVCKQICI